MELSSRVPFGCIAEFWPLAAIRTGNNLRSNQTRATLPPTDGFVHELSD
jgi:hypothetical protein